MTDDGLVLWRLRVRYRKDGRLAFLGHLEVMNTIMRSVRRSGLPFSVGNGFARRMRVQFSQALPVGASSQAEYFDLMLTRRVEPALALEALGAATPAGLAPEAVAYLPRKVPALEAWATVSRWSCDLMGEGLDASDLERAVARMRDRGALEYRRGEKTKRVDLTETLVSIAVDEAPDGLCVDLMTRSTNEASLRPAVLFDKAMGEEPLLGARLDYARVTRLGQWHATEDGRLVEPLEMTFGEGEQGYSGSAHTEQ